MSSLPPHALNTLFAVAATTGTRLSSASGSSSADPSETACRLLPDPSGPSGDESRFGRHRVLHFGAWRGVMAAAGKAAASPAPITTRIARW